MAMKKGKKKKCAQKGTRTARAWVVVDPDGSVYDVFAATGKNAFKKKSDLFLDIGQKAHRITITY